MTHNAAQTKLQDRLAHIFTYLFSSHHADRFTSEQVVDKFGNERTEGKKKKEMTNISTAGTLNYSGITDRTKMCVRLYSCRYFTL